jgi:hypothetical protein
MKLRLSAAIAILAASSLLVLAQRNLPAQGNPSMTNPRNALERIAHDATPDNPDSIRALAHGVVNFPHVYGFPSELSVLLEADLSRSEIAYRNGLGPGVKEEQVLSLLNELANKLNLPQYVQTTPAQVRNLRMRLAIVNPSLMGSGLTSHTLEKGAPVSDTMSPLQAFHLLGTMIDQKIFNDLYQDPSIDIVHAEKERQEEYRRKAAATGKDHVLEARSNPRSLEVRTAIEKGITSMSIAESIELVNHSLTAMGLK